jgi:hypothetical protein
MKSSAQQKPLDLQRGLFLIKYEAADDIQHPPRVTLSIDRSSEDAVEFILPPGVSEPVLWSPGASLIAKISSNARLFVEVAGRGPNRSVGARIQSVVLSTDPMGLADAEEIDIDDEVDFAGLRVLGHLAGRGDTFVPAGEWLGGPMAPSRIEGIAVDWPGKPANFNLSYAVRIGGAAPAATDLSEAGAFSGTRGRALPLVGATLEVSGAAAKGYQITADAIFLGSPQMRVSGQRVVLSGPTGREPLVGLRLQIAPIAAVDAPVERQIAAPAAPAPVTPTKTGSGRVRVFRSKGAAAKA